MPRRRRILIIKLGHSETLVPHVRTVCSLGDVLRTTVVLHLFKEDEVTWLTDARALPLLEGNPYVDRLLPFDAESVLALEIERFDKVINLEKDPAVCGMADRIDAWSHYGFRLDEATGKVEAYDEAYEALAMATSDDLKRLSTKTWNEVLYEMLGAQWQGESFLLGYRSSTGEQYDVGFNTHVGSLIPVKAWPDVHWKALESRLAGRFSITHQRHLNDLRGYMDWIHSCRALVTNDSLGVYLALALGKQVVALFGPTSHSDQSPHERLHVLTPEIERECLPCCRAECALGDPCMNYISPQCVAEAVMDCLAPSTPSPAR